MGRPRKLAASKAVRGQVRAEGKPVQAKRGRPEPPECVSSDPVALAVWNWVADQCEQMGVLTLADRLALEMLAMEYAELQKAKEIVETDGMILVSEKGGRYSHPALNIAASAKKRIAVAMTDLGLTPRAREQLNVQLAAIREPGKLTLAEYNRMNPGRNA